MAGSPSLSLPDRHPPLPRRERTGEKAPCLFLPPIVFHVRILLSALQRLFTASSGEMYHGQRAPKS